MRLFPGNQSPPETKIRVLHNHVRIEKDKGGCDTPRRRDDSGDDVMDLHRALGPNTSCHVAGIMRLAECDACT